MLQRWRSPPVALALCVLLVLQGPGCCAADDDYGDDAFWKPAPPPPAVKEKVDPNTGERLVATTFRFLKARLRPSRKRTLASTSEIAAQLNEMFVDEGMSHNKATAMDAHVVSVQTRDVWDEVRDAIFSHAEVYDVVAKDATHTRHPDDPPYGTLWRQEFGDSVPEPLGSPPAGQPKPQPVTKAGRGAKSKSGGSGQGKGKKRTSKRKGGGRKKGKGAPEL